jgi:cell wall assembly regulator SMI1
MSDLSNVLDNLEAWITAEVPDLLEDLAGPATEQALDLLRQAYGNDIPDDLIVLYSWHDGGDMPDPWWELSEIEEVIRTKRLHESMTDLHETANWWRDTWIPVASDGDGNHLCVDLEGSFDGIRGQVLVFMHDASERTIVAPSLFAYFDAMLQACRQGVLEWDDEEGFFTDDNQDAWQAFLDQHLDGYPLIRGQIPS